MNDNTSNKATNQTVYLDNEATPYAAVFTTAPDVATASAAATASDISPWFPFPIIGAKTGNWAIFEREHKEHFW